MKILFNYKRVIYLPAILCIMQSTLHSQDVGGAAAEDWGFGNTPTNSVSTTTPNNPAFNSETEESGTADYVVKRGDCLWNLSFQFLGNPFQWPSIWQMNPYIKNPDLIFPGDRLKIPDRRTGETISNGNTTISPETAASQSAPISPLQSRTGELLRTANLQKQKADSVLMESDNDSLILSIIRSKNQLGGGFFTSVPFLWFERNASGVLLPGESTIDPPSDRAIYQLYDKIVMTIHKGENFKAGDSLDIYAYFRVVEHNRARAAILRCVGSAAILEVKNGKAVATLYKAYDRILGGEHVMKAKQPVSREIDTLIESDISIQGTVITRAEETASPYVFQTLIIDKGSQDGVKAGDIFAVYQTKGNVLSGAVAALGYTANVQKNSSSLTIVKMSSNKINTGDKTVLIRRTIFNTGVKN